MVGLLTMATTKRTQLLSVSSDAKTVKGEKRGFLTGILYMAPAESAGVGNLCPFASLGCKSGCLDTAGLASVYPDTIHAARERKARFFMQEREAFFWNLVKDIEALIRAAIRRDLIPAVRLNGTTDVKWESQRFGPERKTIFERFTDVQFYDYTKWPASKRSEIPANFHLTHSRAEDNEAMVLDALKFGRSVAVVFSTPAKTLHKPAGKLPEWWNGYRVIDGDESDLRFLDDAQVVVGLRAKGDAKHDTSGFVVQV